MLQIDDTCGLMLRFVAPQLLLGHPLPADVAVHLIKRKDLEDQADKRPEKQEGPLRRKKTHLNPPLLKIVFVSDMRMK